MFISLFFFAQPGNMQFPANCEYFQICESSYKSLGIFWLDNSTLDCYPETWGIPRDTRTGRVRQKTADKPDPYSHANGILCPCQKILKCLRSPPPFTNFGDQRRAKLVGCNQRLGLD